ncbi:sensor histidine kinase [Thalassorhabdomicrobium marinisediminis]|uniref:sensor histidine kinase n=1 Tax=Thalassorhabdomicrobium marinisediminis TaxID=2170577 RepID=UPI0024935A55|nr:ATP-binding protein [Thalassorhabdomicrobium marinisediminis]
MTLFDQLTELTGDGLCLCEMITDAEGAPVDYRFLQVNALFEDYTGLKDATGRTARELVPELEQDWIDTYARVGLHGEKLRFENGSTAMGRWFEVYATPAEPQGRFMILFRDVTPRKHAELEREAALAQSKRLFSELNHRVKNSLAIVNSVISMEARNAPEDAQPRLTRLSNRVTAIGALYEAMAVSDAIDKVQADDYLGGIVDNLRDALAQDEDITITAQIAPLILAGRHAVCIGLILNEVITNSVKHAFTADSSGQVDVTLTVDGDEVVTTVADNGRGMADNGTPPTGLGSRLVNAFVQDLDGTIDRTSSDKGTTTTIRFPKPDTPPA